MGQAVSGLVLTAPSANNLCVVSELDSPQVLTRFNESLDLVHRLCRKLARTSGAACTAEELESFGMEGLLEAARRFDPDRGVPFRGYATFRVKGAIIDGVRSMARLPRHVHDRLKHMDAGQSVSEGAYEDLCAQKAPGQTAPNRHDAERGLRDHLAAMATAMATGMVMAAARAEDGSRDSVDPGPSPESMTERSQLATLLREALLELPHDEAELVRRHYLLGERFDHVAAELGYSKSWASRLHKRALQRLMKRMPQRV